MLVSDEEQLARWLNTCVVVVFYDVGASIVQQASSRYLCVWIEYILQGPTEKTLGFQEWRPILSSKKLIWSWNTLRLDAFPA